MLFIKKTKQTKTLYSPYFSFLCNLCTRAVDMSEAIHLFFLLWHVYDFVILKAHTLINIFVRHFFVHISCLNILSDACSLHFIQNLGANAAVRFCLCQPCQEQISVFHRLHHYPFLLQKKLLVRARILSSCFFCFFVLFWGRAEYTPTNHSAHPDEIAPPT